MVYWQRNGCGQDSDGATRKILMQAGGIIKSDTMRHPLPTVHHASK
jgi:hypothetical protein